MSASKRENIEKARAAVILGAEGISVLEEILSLIPESEIHLFLGDATHRPAAEIDLELLNWLLDQPKFHSRLTYFAHSAGQMGDGGRELLRRVFEIGSSVEIAERAAYSFGRHGMDSVEILEWISSKEPEAEVWTNAVKFYTEVHGCAGDMGFIEECVARSSDPDILLEIGESAGAIGRECAIKILEWVLERCSSPNLFERIGFGAGMSDDGIPILEWIIGKTDDLEPLWQAAYICSYDDETGEYPIINWILDRYDDPFLLSRCAGTAMEDHPHGIPAMEKILAKCDAPEIWEEAAYGAACRQETKNLEWIFSHDPLPSVFVGAGEGNRWILLGQSSFELAIPITWQIDYGGGHYLGTALSAIPYDVLNTDQRVEFIVWSFNPEADYPLDGLYELETEFWKEDGRRVNNWRFIKREGDQFLHLEVQLYSNEDDNEDVADILRRQLPLSRLGSVYL
jgi:hypothetical protein